MASAAPSVSFLSAENAAFVQQGVSVIAGARDRDNVPTLVRGVGCRVAADRDRVTVFLPASQCAELLANVRDNGAIAVVFCQPSTHRTIQLKGTDATVVPLAPGDHERMAAQAAALAADIIGIGYREAPVRTLLAYAPEDVVAVAFTPAAAFQQTPGPNAGARIPG
ncbi:MAG: hypothetical protein ACOZDY_10755 [Pseudomonadota bacterium]